MMSISSMTRGGTARRILARTTAIGLVALLAACASPDTRIKRNQAVFDALPTAEQALIREGKVGIGFTPDMVRLAVGDPDQRWIRTDAAGQTEIWSYTSYDSHDGVPIFRGDYHRYAGGFPVYTDAFFARSARAREYFKVSFKDGVVTMIEQDARR
jgi:hypothetical protein